MKLFGTDGVRGEAGKDLTAGGALKLGLAAGSYFRDHSKSNRILVGKDTRRSGYMIENAIVSGLTAVGYNVIQVGPMPTPAVAYLTEDMRCDAGIMISASHNPFLDNGIKFFDRHGCKLDVQAEQQIESLYDDEKALERCQRRGIEIGSSKRIDDVIGRYIVHIKNSFPKDLSLYGLRVVVDPGNGAAYKVAPTIFSELGADVFMINDRPNGQNINENCGATDPVMLAEHVIRYRADIGFALDGDADRCVVVDEEGNLIDGDKLIGALALHHQQTGQLKNSAIVATVMSNQGLENFLKKHGIGLHRCAVGDKHVFEMMQQHELNFGGEQSGHIIFSDYAKTGDGLVSALQSCSCLLREGKKASEVMNPFELLPQVQKNLAVVEKKPLEEIEGLEERLKNLEKRKIRHLIRYSGTENKLRVLLEGEEEKVLLEETDTLVEFLQKAINA